MTEGNLSLHYTNLRSLVLLVGNNLFQGWMESRDTDAALKRCGEQYLESKDARVSQMK